MNIAKLKDKASRSGFTIVELLIVIVVIGILAAITLVAYNGIQNRAKSAQYQSDAANIVKVAEAVNAGENSAGYPYSATAVSGATALALFNSGDAKLPANVAITTITSATADPTTSAAGPSVSGSTRTYTVKTCGASTGLEVYYWDAAANPAAVKTLTAGTGC